MNTEIKKTIVEHCFEYSKYLIEDDRLPTAQAYDAGELSQDDMETFVEKCKAKLLVLIEEGEL